MLRNLKLLLPALVPSWRFFDVIAPSPRIEYRLMHPPDEPLDDWREFRPRPARVSLTALISRLLWNPVWNETLYLVSCAERLLDAPTTHGSDEITRRIAADLRRGSTATAPPPLLQFRLVLVSRTGETLEHEVAFVSAPTRHDDARLP